MTTKPTVEEKPILVQKPVYVDPIQWEDYKLGVQSINSTITKEINRYLTGFNERYRRNIDMLKSLGDKK